MKDIIRSLFGNYELQYNTDGSLITGFAGLDYEYLAGVLLFTVCLIGVLGLIRTFLKWGVK